MAKIEQYSRILHHRINTPGQPFTVPTSNDHTDETWSANDLYIGEIGVNVSDDKIYVRTNNGIIQIGTTSSQIGTASNTMIVSGANLKIATGITASAMTRNVASYTDLGDTSLRWQDVYLGGRTSGRTLIDVNVGLNLTETSGVGILTSSYDPSTNAPIQIYTQSSILNHDRPLHLNSNDVIMEGTGNERVSIGSKGVVFQTLTHHNTVIGTNVTIYTGITASVHLGHGFGKTNYDTQTVVVGNLAIRGISDDGSLQYIKSDWTTNQARLRTTNATTTNMATLNWDAYVGSAVQVKAYILASDISDTSLCYSAEVMGVFTLDGNNLTHQIGTPIINEVSGFTGTQPSVTMVQDGTGIRIKVTGTAGNTIQWLCTYSYHKLVNITV